MQVFSCTMQVCTSLYKSVQVCASLCNSVQFCASLSKYPFFSKIQQNSLWKSYKVQCKAEQVCTILCKPVQVCASLCKYEQVCASLCKLPTFSTISTILSYISKKSLYKSYKNPLQVCASQCKYVQVCASIKKIIYHVLSSHSTHQYSLKCILWHSQGPWKSGAGFKDWKSFQSCFNWSWIISNVCNQ